MYSKFDEQRISILWLLKIEVNALCLLSFRLKSKPWNHQTTVRRGPAPNGMGAMMPGSGAAGGDRGRGRGGPAQPWGPGAANWGAQNNWPNWGQGAAGWDQNGWGQVKLPLENSAVIFL